MKKSVIFISINMMFFIAIQTAIAQCVCDAGKLVELKEGLDIKLVADRNSDASVTAISEGTNYYLRVAFTTGTCRTYTYDTDVTNDVTAPAMVGILFADGCVREEMDTTGVLQDVPITKSSQYWLDAVRGEARYFNIKTLSGADFLPQIYLKVGAACSPHPQYNPGNADSERYLKPISKKGCAFALTKIKAG